MHDNVKVFLSLTLFSQRQPRNNWYLLVWLTYQSNKGIIFTNVCMENMPDICHFFFLKENSCFVWRCLTATARLKEFLNIFNQPAGVLHQLFLFRSSLRLGVFLNLFKICNSIQRLTSKSIYDILLGRKCKRKREGCRNRLCVFQ